MPNIFKINTEFFLIYIDRIFSVRFLLELILVWHFSYLPSRSIIIHVKQSALSILYKLKEYFYFFFLFSLVLFILSLFTMLEQFTHFEYNTHISSIPKTMMRWAENAIIMKFTGGTNRKREKKKKILQYAYTKEEKNRMIHTKVMYPIQHRLMV